MFPLMSIDFSFTVSMMPYWSNAALMLEWFLSSYLWNSAALWPIGEIKAVVGSAVKEVLAKPKLGISVQGTGE